MNKHRPLFDLSINKNDLNELIEDSLKKIINNEQAVFACANAHSLIVSENDAVFKGALQDAEYLVADGSGIILAARILNTYLGPRITGYDYFYALSYALNKGINNRKARVFFLGSSEHTLNEIKKNMELIFPGIELCGLYSPPYGEWSEEESQKILGLINEAAPDVLWVGMTAPKQEIWAFHNRNKLNASIIGSIGAVFDFFAGTLERAPKWMRKLGLEWLYRFIKEPRRTWRRHLISEPKFVIKVLLMKYYL